MKICSVRKTEIQKQQAQNERALVNGRGALLLGLLQRSLVGYTSRSLGQTRGLVWFLRHQLARQGAIARNSLQWCSIRWGRQALRQWAKAALMRGFHMWHLTMVRIWADEHARVVSSLPLPLVPAVCTQDGAGSASQDMRLVIKVMEDFEVHLQQERQNSARMTAQMAKIKFLGGEIQPWDQPLQSPAHTGSPFQQELERPLDSEIADMWGHEPLPSIQPFILRQDLGLAARHSFGPEGQKPPSPPRPQYSPRPQRSPATPMFSGANSLTDDLQQMQRNLRSMMF